MNAQPGSRARLLETQIETSRRCLRVMLSNAATGFSHGGEIEQENASNVAARHSATWLKALE